MLLDIGSKSTKDVLLALTCCGMEADVNLACVLFPSSCGGPMQMIERQIYRCQNRDCGCEVTVIRSSIEANANPRCCCRAEMKKPYQKPVLRTLNSDGEALISSKANRN